MVTTKTIYKCDICGTEVDNAGELATLKIPCRVFDSEGRSSTASFRDVDMCPRCIAKYETVVFNHFGILYDTMGNMSFEDAYDAMREDVLKEANSCVKTKLLKRVYTNQIARNVTPLSDAMLALMKGITKSTGLLICGTVPSRNPILTATDGMQIRGYGLSSLSDAKNREVRYKYEKLLL